MSCGNLSTSGLMKPSSPLSDLFKKGASASIPTLGGPSCRRLPASHISRCAVGILDACLRTGWHPYFTWGLADLKASPRVFWVWFICFCTCFLRRLCLLLQRLDSVVLLMGQAVRIPLPSPGSFWSPSLLLLSISLKAPCWYYHNISLFHLQEAESFLISMLIG